jgi:DNA polymerase
VSSRRELFLEEIGLTPLWRLKGRATGERGAEEQRAEEPFAVRVGAVEPTADDRGERIAHMDWPELNMAVAGCTACGLRKTCTRTVFGVGDERAEWLLVGEAPGAEEDARGEPFVGQAGKLLDAMLAGIALKRGENVYIANVLKCRPPGNRNPEQAEVAQCSPFLRRQVELIRPKLILALGRFACQTLLDTDASIASLRGRLHRYQGVPLIVSYHPAYLLRSLPDKAKAWEDLCFARSAMADLRTRA